MKRYMVFTWSEYDNVDPFGCLDGTFDDVEIAIAHTKEAGTYTDDGKDLFCVFDRIDGAFI